MKLPALSPHRRPAIIFWVFAFIAALLMEWPNAVVQLDDFFYSGICRDNLYLTTHVDYEPVENLGDIVTSEINHYKYVNGRVIVHSLVQLFIVFLGYDALTIFIALLTVIAIELIARLAAGVGRQPSTTLRLASFALFLLIMPFGGMQGTWFGCAAYSINYAFSGCVTLAMLYLFKWLERRGKRRCGFASALGWMLLGFLVGQIHEGFTWPVIAGLVLYMIVRRKRVNAAMLWLTAGYFIGGVFVLLSSTANRPTLVDNPSRMKSYLSAVFYDLYSVYETLIPPFILLLLTGVLSLFRCLRQATAIAIKRSGIYLTAALACLVSTTFVAIKFTHVRALSPMELMMVLYSATLAVEIARSHYHSTSLRRGVQILSAIVIVAFTAGFTAQGVANRTRYQQRWQEFAASDSGYVVIDGRVPKKMWNMNENGPHVPEPFDISNNNFWQCANFDFGVGHNAKHIRFIPPLDSINDRNLVIDTDSMRVWTRPDAWWIVIEGGSKIERFKNYFIATDYTPYRPGHRLYEYLRPYHKVDHCHLAYSIIHHDGHEYVIVSKRNNLSFRSIEVLDSLHRPIYRLQVAH